MASSDSDALADMLGPWQAACLEAPEDPSEEEAIDLDVVHQPETGARHTSLVTGSSSHVGLGVTMPCAHPSQPPTPSSTLETLMKQALNKISELNIGNSMVSEPEVLKIGELYCRETPQLHASNAAMAAVAGVNPAELEPTLAPLTTAMLQPDKMCKQTLDQVLANSSAELLLYVQLSRYDETSMRIRQKHFFQQTYVDADTGHPSATTPTATSVQAGALSPADALQATTISKMFSSEQKYAYLLKVNIEGSSGRQTGFVAVTGPMLSWNQLLARATGECMHQALREGNAINSLAHHHRQSHCERGLREAVAPRKRTSLAAFAFLLQCTPLC